VREETKVDLPFSSQAIKKPEQEMLEVILKKHQKSS